MGTRTKIKIVNKDTYICSKYFNMDGHVRNWAPELIISLNQTSPKDILKNRQLFKFMFDDYESDEFLDYLCIVDIFDNEYNIKIYRFGKEVLFEGNLDQFSEQYDEI